MPIDEIWITGNSLDARFRAVVVARRQHKQNANPIRQAKRRNHVVASSDRRDLRRARRNTAAFSESVGDFAPPEDWHEVTDADIYRVVVRPPGEGYSHVVTPQEVRQRLAEVPAHFLDSLEVVQLSQVTRKKLSFPCYGMQWGNSLYLYPLEESLTEYFYSPPKPNFVNETRMYGAKWRELGEGHWLLEWNEHSARDFYLNNILMHELGHLLDDRNTTYKDRERYAEWFAVEYGYRRTGGRDARQRRRRSTRRHHKK